MNILIVITPYSPAQTPNIIRWESIINYYLSKGISVTVLSSKWGNLKEFSSNNNLSIYRYGHHTLLDKLNDFFGIKQRRNSVEKSKVFKVGFGRKILEKLVDIFWRKSYWPDGSVYFLKSARKKLTNIITEQNITHVVSVGIPFTCHLLAKEIKVNHPSIKWLMDIQDPFSFSDTFWVNNFAKHATKNIDEEGKAFEWADAISVTNIKTYQLYTELFASASDKIHVIPPILVLKKTTKELSELKIDSSKFNIGYFGSFYKNVRSPFRFLNFIENIYKEDKALLDNLRFHFFGELNTFSEPIFSLFKHLEKYIIQHGFVSHDKVENYAKSMDRLMNFGNVTEYHLPSKVVEYLYYQKPVINFIRHNEDSSMIFLKDKICLLNLRLNDEDFEEQRTKFFDFLNKDFSQEKKTINYTEYLTENIAEKYLKLLT